MYCGGGEEKNDSCIKKKQMEAIRVSNIQSALYSAHN